MANPIEKLTKSKPIPKDIADQIIRNRCKLYHKIAGNVAKGLELIGIDEAYPNFFKHKGNLFLFTRESVLRHFFEDGDISKEPTASHLAVFLGAHLKDEDIFKIGDPTICITGATEPQENGSGEITFKTVTMGNDPYDEHPPTEIVAKIDKFIDDQDTVTVKIL